jgi:peptide/nickel transport system ATP-binding protein
VNTPLVEVAQLSVGYRNASGEMIHVLRNVSLDVSIGESIGIVGESGCGKSTLALAFMGYLRRGSERIAGTVRFDGCDLFALDDKALTRLRGGQIAVMPQNAGQALTPTLRIGAQIAEALALHTTLSPKAVSSRVLELLTQVRFPTPEVLAHRYPHELSGGQQQRVAIAMAIASQPSLLVLDEPTTGLDVTTQAAILDLLAGLQREMGVAMICVSHDIGMIARLSQRVAVLYGGEIAEMGETQALLRKPLHPYTRGLLAAIPTIHDTAIPRGISGHPPIFTDYSVGCAFAPRCAHADETCRDVSPALDLHRSGDVRQVRCHHFASLLEKTPPLLHRVPSVPSDEQRSPLLELVDVSMRYGHDGIFEVIRRRISKETSDRPMTVQAVGFSVHRGETVALVGESGSGKSTILRAISGLMRPLAGSIAFAGKPLAGSIDQRPQEVRRAIQIIFQNPDASLNPRHTVADILSQPLRLYFRLDERECRQRAAALLERVRLNTAYLTRYPAQLSGGEKQRVAIARAFAAEPDLVLCDEITSALDVSVQAAILELLVDLQRERGTAYIVIAHDLAVVRALADRVAVLKGGRICEIGSVDEIYAPPYHPYTEQLLTSVLQLPAHATHGAGYALSSCTISPSR